MAQLTAELVMELGGELGDGFTGGAPRSRFAACRSRQPIAVQTVAVRAPSVTLRAKAQTSGVKE